MIDHDKRYEMTDDYLRALYKLWEGSWPDDAVKFDVANDVYADPTSTREIYRDGSFYQLDTRCIVPQVRSLYYFFSNLELLRELGHPLSTW